MFQNPSLNEILNRYREKKLAHAYLIETNNIEYALEDIKKLIKVINCKEEFKDSCTKCNLCNLISKNSLPSLKIIEPEGTSIKKNQIEELKESFATIPIYSRFNIYIIKNADKLNSSSTNSMLKFVEEPTEGILGFFITNNKDIMIDTIKSRCQSMVINYDSENIIEKWETRNEEYEAYLEFSRKYLEKIKNNEFINNKKEVISSYPEKEDIENLLKIIFNIYYQNYLKIIGLDYDKKITESINLNQTIEVISQKLNIINQILQNMSYNVNTELILDKFVIEMRDNNG